MGLDYAHEKLSVAVDCLVGSGTLAERFENAYLSALGRLSNGQDLPAELQELLEPIQEGLTSVSDPKRGSLQATLKTLDDEQLQGLAEQVVDLYGHVCAALGLERNYGFFPRSRGDAPLT